MHYSSIKTYFWLGYVFFVEGHGFQIFPEGSNTGFSAGCAAALSVNVTQCNNLVASIDPGEFYNQTVLKKTCTSSCSAALIAWFYDVQSACTGSNDTYVNDYGFESELSDVPGQISFYYNQTCLFMDGEYCNVILANQSGSQAPSNSSTIVCDQCDLQLLKNTAESPYGDGPLVLSEGVYESYTAMCGFTGYPLTTTASTTAASLTTTASAGAETCSGMPYTVRPGDTCNSISLSQGIATNWLLLDNSLQAYCYNFPPSGVTLCLVSLCSVYTVQAGDTCASVAATHNITAIQLLSYNPWVDVGCYNFNSTVGSQICINEPGQKYVAPASTSGVPTAASTAVPMPTNIAQNTTTNCGDYYEVQPGDSCDSVASEYSISVADFRIMNPEINENCTNLFALESYCVLPVGDINNYPGAPGYTGYLSTITPSVYSALPAATYTPYFNPNVLSLAPGTNVSCSTYVDGSNLQFNISGGLSDCAVAADVWGLNVTDLVFWNPSLNVLSNGASNCTFAPYYRYCMWQRPPVYTASVVTTSFTFTSGTETTFPITTASAPATTIGGSTTSTSSAASSTSSSSTAAPPLPTQSDSISRNCNAYAEAVSGDYCYAFSAEHNITTDELYAWNRVLGAGGADCSTAFQANVYYCVGVNIPSPIQADNTVPLDCDLYALAKDGDYCYQFAADNNITTTNLYAWNSVLGTNGADCSVQFWSGEYYCIGVNK